MSLLESGEQRYIKDIQRYSHSIFTTLHNDTFSVTITQHLLPCHSTFTALSLNIYCLAQQHDALSVAQRHVQRYSHSTLMPFTRINSASQPFTVFPFPHEHVHRYSRFTQHSSPRIQTQLRTFPFSTRVSLHPPYAPGSRCTKGYRAYISVQSAVSIVAPLSLR